MAQANVRVHTAVKKFRITAIRQTSESVQFTVEADTLDEANYKAYRRLGKETFTWEEDDWADSPEITDIEEEEVETDEKTFEVTLVRYTSEHATLTIKARTEEEAIQQAFDSSEPIWEVDRWAYDRKLHSVKEIE